MSRRGVSVRELGSADLQGWLQRQTGTDHFLGSGWRRNWFVLKNGSLYWFPSHMAEEAEGFLDLTDFTIQPIRVLGKQHGIKLSRPQVATVVVATEGFTEMSLWLDKLSAALLQTRAPRCSTRECYSQTSGPDSEESVSYCSPPDTELATMATVSGEFPPPCFTSSPSCPSSLRLLAPRRRRRPGSSGSRTSSSENSEAGSFWRPGSWGDPVHHPADPAAFLLGVEQGGPRGPGESRPEHAETSSPIGRTKPTNQGGRRGSWASPYTRERRQEKLYLVRILNPPPKTEEADLLAMETLLTNPTRTALSCWNCHNKFILLQEISRHQRPAGGARDRRVRAAEQRVVETSV